MNKNQWTMEDMSRLLVELEATRKERDAALADALRYRLLKKHYAEILNVDLLVKRAEAWEKV